MSFRKRNIGLSSSRTPQPPLTVYSEQTADSPSVKVQDTVINHAQIPGVRPSALDGRPTTSTGTPSLDGLLAGHAGLALGNSILLEESGTTDYAGTLLRYYAAEGVVQGHQVHVVGVGEQWGRDLPGLVGTADGEEKNKAEGVENREKMKIAWRYERLGEFGVGGSSPSSRGKSGLSRKPNPLRMLTTVAPQKLNRAPSVSTPGDEEQHIPKPFCHSFDLTKRLTLPNLAAVNFISIRQANTSSSPFTSIIQAIVKLLATSGPDTIHRLVIPTMLSPAFYPPHSSNPRHVLQFLHSLRALLRKFPSRLTTMVSLPLTLYPRTTGLVRWMEILSDGVIELIPFPHTIDTGPSLTTSGAATSQEDKPQGMVKVHCLPVFHERGGGGIGGAGVGDDLAFTVSRRKFVIKPFSLPPVEGDTEAQRGEVEGGKTKIDIDF